MTMNGGFLGNRQKAGGILIALLLCLLAFSSFSAKAALSSQDKADIARAEGWLNGVTTMKARFLQVSATGGAAEGTLYIKRPGLLRLEYDDPTPVLVVADGSYLIYHDKKLVQTSYVALESTPAAILVKKNPQLNGGDLKVIGVSRDAGVLTITLTKPGDAAIGRVSLIFSEAPFELRKWHVIDPQGQATTVSLFDIKQDIALDRELFRFHDPNFFKNQGPLQ